MKFFKKNYRIIAFSLIEISIVLIIISLLIASIIQGVALIRSAKTRSILTEVRGIENALYAYYAYKGDFPIINNSSQLLFENNCALWKELLDNKIITNVNIKNCDNTDPVNIIKNESYLSNDKSLFYTIGYNNSLKRNTIFLLANNEEIGAPKETVEILSNISYFPETTIKKTNTSSLSNKQAREIDKKVDDAEFDSGSIQSFSSNNNLKECEYNDSENKNCTISFAFGEKQTSQINKPEGPTDNKPEGCYISTLKNATIDYNISSYGKELLPPYTYISGRCKTGYETEQYGNNPYAYCIQQYDGSNAKWQEGVNCIKARGICDNAKLSEQLQNANFSATTGTTKLGGKQTATCNTGYYFQNNNSSEKIEFICKESNYWQSDAYPYCAKIQCSINSAASKLGLNSTFLGSETWKTCSNSDCSITSTTIYPSSSPILVDFENYIIFNECKAGYEKKSGSIKLKCSGSNNNWTTITNDAICVKLADIEVFNYTGSSQPFTIPDGTTKITIKVYGGEGGQGYREGAKGGYSYGQLSVSPGEVLNIFVGQKGTGRSLPSYNGGAAGGGGGGGGKTHITNSSGKLLIVAGGGGGAGTGGNYKGGSGGGGNNCGEKGSIATTGGCNGIGGAGATLNDNSGCPFAGIDGTSTDGGKGASPGGGGGGGGYGGGGGGCSGGSAGSGGAGGGGYIGGVTSGGGSNGDNLGDGYAKICWGSKLNNC